MDKIELKPNPKCKLCWGRGYVRIISPHLDADKFREVRPRQCVKAIVSVEELQEVSLKLWMSLFATSLTAICWYILFFMAL